MRKAEWTDRQHLPLDIPKNLASKTYFFDKKGSSKRARHAAARAAACVREVAEPRAVRRLVRVVPGYPYCFLDDLRFPVRSRLISGVLSQCDTAVVCAVSLGEQLDEVLRDPSLSAHDQWVFDQVATAAVEAVMDKLEAEITTGLQRGYDAGRALTARYSPGYCDWPLTEQRLMFALLRPEKIGLTLSESYLMQPQKSVTAVMGIGDAARVAKHGIACRRCDRPRCPFRRRAYDSDQSPARNQGREAKR